MSEMLKSKVLWVPAPPKSGIVSMFRYWEELRKANARSLNNVFEIEDLVPFPEGFRRENKWSRAFEKYVTYPYAVSRVKKYNVVHGLAHDAGVYMKYAPKGGARVVTVHDLIPMVYSKDITKSQLARFTKHAHMLADMDKLVAVSAYTGLEIERLLGVPSEKIKVAPNGVDAEFFKRPRVLPDSVNTLGGKPYILSVSGVLQRKNLSVLPPLFEELKRKGVDCALVRAGAPLPISERDQLRAVLGDSLIEVGRCDDDELAALYQGASCFVFPSLYEGFGLPVLEAMAASCPVVTSNSSSLPEVAGNAAELVDPTDVDEMVSAVEKVLNDPEKYTQLGLSRVKKFTWDSHLDSLVEVYQEFNT